MSTMRAGVGERGATALMVAASMMLLLGFASLAIDAGMGLGDRRGAQNAADLAALGAAWQDCNEDATERPPVEVARDVAEANGYDDLDPEIEVDVDPEGTGWKVVISGTLETSLGRVTPYAPDSLEVTAAATAECVKVGILEGYVVFGKDTPTLPACPTQVDLSANSSLAATGNIHSNEALRLNTSAGISSLHGRLTYRTSVTGNAAGGAIEYFGSPIGYPEEINGYSPNGGTTYTFSGDIHPDDIVNHSPQLGTMSGGQLVISEPGIYQTTGDIDLGDVRLVMDAASEGVTFSAGGAIDIGELENFRGYDSLVTSAGPAVAFYANGGGTCTDIAIDIGDGGDVNWEGIAFAPNGTIDIEADELVVAGSLIGAQVDVSGEDIDITFVDDSSIPPSFEVNLVG